VDEDEIAALIVGFFRRLLVEVVEVVEAEPLSVLSVARVEEYAVLGSIHDRLVQLVGDRLDLNLARLVALLLLVENEHAEARAGLLELLYQVEDLVGDHALGGLVVVVLAQIDALAERDVLKVDDDVGLAAEVGELLADVLRQSKCLVLRQIEAPVILEGIIVDADDEGGGEQDLEHDVDAGEAAMRDDGAGQAAQFAEQGEDDGPRAAGGDDHAGFLEVERLPHDQADRDGDQPVQAE